MASKKILKWAIVPAVLLLLVLGACTFGSDLTSVEAPEVSSEDAPSEADPVIVDESEAQSAPEEGDQASVQDEDQASVAQEDDAEQAKPQPKQGLSATDPTTVNLASGEPILVEFFAFW